VFLIEVDGAGGFSEAVLLTQFLDEYPTTKIGKVLTNTCNPQKGCQRDCIELGRRSEGSLNGYYWPMPGIAFVNPGASFSGRGGQFIFAALSVPIFF